MAAVRSSTASDPRSAPRPPASGRRPERTCIGCRSRAPADELLRTVAAPEPAGTESISRPVPVVPDPRACAAGRGAWVHPDPGCVDLAERRRAYARALRVPGPVDPTAVRVYLAEAVQKVRPRSGGSWPEQQSRPTDRPKPAGEVTSHGHSMKHQR
jgi:predicted RNA-binding protein YlxR (DUF448 family)